MTKEKEKLKFQMQECNTSTHTIQQLHTNIVKPDLTLEGGDEMRCQIGAGDIHKENNPNFHLTPHSCNIYNINMQLPKQALFPTTGAPLTYTSAQDSHEDSSNQSQQKKYLADLYQPNTKKNKIIRKKLNLLQRATLPPIPSTSHVFNFLGLISINDRTLRDSTYQESFYRSMFYIRSVEKVELRRHALLVFTHNANDVTPTLRSYGDKTFYRLAVALEKSEQLYSGVNLRRDLAKSYEMEPLARFIEAMQDRIYMCKLAPNRILISRRLLEFMGEDPQLYGVRICKYKTPLDEIMSGGQYASVIAKSVENIGLLCSFLQGNITIEELQEQSRMQFDDYLYARQKKMYCRFMMSMPSPLMSCLQVKEELGKPIQGTQGMRVDHTQRQRMQRQVTAHSYGETSILKHLIELPDNLLADHSARIAGYAPIQR